MLSVTVVMTRAEAIARAALLEVHSYRVDLDVRAVPQTARSHTEIRFGCREPGAVTFADLTTPLVHRVTLNGARLDPDSVIADGRLRLTELAARPAFGDSPPCLTSSRMS